MFQLHISPRSRILGYFCQMKTEEATLCLWLLTVKPWETQKVHFLKNKVYYYVRLHISPRSHILGYICQMKTKEAT